MSAIRVYPESTAGASPGFTRVDVDGQPHLTLTDFPAYAALGRAQARIKELEAQVAQSAMAMTLANLDARSEYRLAETWRAHAKVEDDLRDWLRLCTDDPAGHAEFYAWASHLYFGTPPPEEES